MLCDDGRIVLIDFGLHKQLEVTRSHTTRQLTATTRLGTEGYARPEQYLQHAPVGTFTDIYALSATLYFLLAGQAPISAPERAMGGTLLPLQQVNPLISPAVNSAVMQAMEMTSEQRPQTARIFLGILKLGVRPTPSTPTSNPMPAGVRPSASSQAPNAAKGLSDLGGIAESQGPFRVFRISDREGDAVGLPQRPGHGQLIVNRHAGLLWMMR